MRTVLTVLGLILIGSAAPAWAWDEPKEAPAAKGNATPDRKDDEKAIRAADEAFVKAYNAGDAKAISELFAEDADAVDEEGDIVQGREALAVVFDEIFEESPGSKIEVDVDSIRFLGDSLAMETGRTKVTPKDGGSPEFSRFSVLYAKQKDGKWLQAHVRELAEKHVSPHDRLKELEWMVGEWVEEDSHAVVSNTCRWSEDGNFLLRQFSIQISGKPALSGTQRIGWDPSARQIRSWVFDSDGGFGEGYWTRSGNQWAIRSHTTRPDGHRETSTQVLTLVNAHSARWKSVDRVAGGKILPDIDEIVMVKTPPKPQ
ncbi:YybH family protein [Singulisphaera sp. PoT]|uniref:YybH family protein n=1 Tax=Singulisphaera sp. PoT TaxID=3411797 RepID=UPI003BF47030